MGRRQPPNSTSVQWTEWPEGTLDNGQKVVIIRFPGSLTVFGVRALRVFGNGTSNWNKVSTNGGLRYGKICSSPHSPCGRAGYPLSPASDDALRLVANDHGRGQRHGSRPVGGACPQC